jgi:hypothetical protein
MTVRLGCYEICPSEIPRFIKHAVDHFDFMVMDFLVDRVSFITFGAKLVPDPYKELHDKIYTKGTYEVIHRV